MARIVLNTFGSFGDLHPYLAIALELQRRGHECVIATSEVYRRKVVGEGLGFAQVRPDVGELMNQPETLRKLWDPRRGSQFLIENYLMPAVADAFSDLDRACVKADLLISHAVAYAAPVVARARKIPWLSVALQPAIFFSRKDPAVIAAAPWLRHIATRAPWLFSALMSFADRQTRGWVQPVFELRKSLGLPDTSNPVMDGQFSPYGTLTLLSKYFAEPQADWPPLSEPTGFVFYDKRGEIPGLDSPSSGLSPALEQFLAAGPPPVLFTLGSSAVLNAEDFYHLSADAARSMRTRAVLLLGKQSVAPNEFIHTEEYAEYSAIMPRVSAVVHSGGIGTVAQCLRAGKPMLVVPWAHDQPDNAYRLERLGVARVLPRNRYRASSAVSHLNALLNPASGYEERAKKLAAPISREDGVGAACDRIENVLVSLLAH